MKLSLAELKQEPGGSICVGLANPALAGSLALPAGPPDLWFASHPDVHAKTGLAGL